jgi:ubiquinone/menaquinone biosynthesis C-methylase UbiE
VERAQAVAAERGISNIRFEVGNIYELPFPESSFDATFAHAVLPGGTSRG